MFCCLFNLVRILGVLRRGRLPNPGLFHLLCLAPNLRVDQGRFLSRFLSPGVFVLSTVKEAVSVIDTISPPRTHSLGLSTCLCYE